MYRELSFLAALSLATASWAQPNAPRGPVDCTECHDQRAGAHPAEPTFVAALSISVHKSMSCTDCHQAMELREGVADPHDGKVPAVNCGECHEEEAQIYKKHGRLEVDRDPDLPRCWSCHGSHDILASSDRHSSVHTTNLPRTCRTCHTDVDLVKKHFILRDKPIKLYESSVHGRATQKGLYVAAACSDCHSAPDQSGRRTAHRILSPADAESTIFRFNIPDTCGKCHPNITQDYWEGIHGQYVKRGAADAPVCTNCHGEHGIVPPRDPHSPVSATRVAEETCAPCHESALLNEKYGLPGGRLASYIDSYHGLKSKAGDATVANCASCHGSHRILPSTDPQSSIHAANLRGTCGECHPAISEELAQTKIHATATGLRAGWPEFFRKLYLVIIVGTIGFMVLHNAADWLRYVKQMSVAPFIQRLTPSEVGQHWVLMISFTVLVITGFSLRFAEAGWARWLFGWEGGFEARGVIHRVAAVVMVVGAVWHVLYLFTARGRHWFRDMSARWSDVRTFGDNLKYFLGLRKSGARFGRFSYMEKLEYWALAWGTLIMSATGILLWFDNYFTRHWHLPKGLLDVMLVIHYYEAWLAFLAILVWHVYGTLFKPGVYPMNPAWLTGKMPGHMYTEEHPDGPKLAARLVRVRYEEPVEQAAEPAVLPATGDSKAQSSRAGQTDGRPARPELKVTVP
jgi:cytochrome b subunit of formate dehydrogenase